MVGETNSSKRRIAGGVAAFGIGTAVAAGMHFWPHVSKEAAAPATRPTLLPSATAKPSPICSLTSQEDDPTIVSGVTFLRAKLGSCASEQTLKNTADPKAPEAIVPEGESPVLKVGNQVLISCQVKGKDHEDWVQVYKGNYDDSDYGFLPAQVFGNVDHLRVDGAELPICNQQIAD